MVCSGALDQFFEHLQNPAAVPGFFVPKIQILVGTAQILSDTLDAVLVGPSNYFAMFLHDLVSSKLRN